VTCYNSQNLTHATYNFTKNIINILYKIQKTRHLEGSAIKNKSKKATV